MKTAEVYKQDDIKYKNGFIKCDCGWSHELGNGFNGYYIKQCPECTPELETRIQRKVTYGENKSLTVDIGDNRYFVMSNGIHVRYHIGAITKYTGLTERQADRL